MKSFLKTDDEHLNGAQLKGVIWNGLNHKIEAFDFENDPSVVDYLQKIDSLKERVSSEDLFQILPQLFKQMIDSKRLPEEFQDTSLANKQKSGSTTAQSVRYDINCSLINELTNLPETLNFYYDVLDDKIVTEPSLKTVQFAEIPAGGSLGYKRYTSGFLREITRYIFNISEVDKEFLVQKLREKILSGLPGYKEKAFSLQEVKSPRENLQKILKNQMFIGELDYSSFVEILTLSLTTFDSDLDVFAEVFKRCYDVRKVHEEIVSQRLYLGPDMLKYLRLDECNSDTLRQILLNSSSRGFGYAYTSYHYDLYNLKTLITACQELEIDISIEEFVEEEKLVSETAKRVVDLVKDKRKSWRDNIKNPYVNRRVSRHFDSADYMNDSSVFVKGIGELKDKIFGMRMKSVPLFFDKPQLDKILQELTTASLMSKTVLVSHPNLVLGAPKNPGPEPDEPTTVGTKTVDFLRDFKDLKFLEENPVHFLEFVQDKVDENILHTLFYFLKAVKENEEIAKLAILYLPERLENVSLEKYFKYYYPDLLDSDKWKVFEDETFEKLSIKFFPEGSTDIDKLIKVAGWGTKIPVTTAFLYRFVD